MLKIRSVFVGLASGVALALSVAGASADGTGRRSAKDTSYSPGYNWSGLYFGLGAGWQQTNIDGVVTNFTGGGAAPPNQFWNVEDDGNVFSGIVGVQHQIGSIVIGVEAAWNSTISGSSRSPTTDCVSAVGDRQCNAGVSGLFTVGPRLGLAFGNVMIYGTGGYAEGTIKSQLLQASTGTALIFSKSDNSGHFFGGGIEWAPARNLVFGLEYQRVQLDSEAHQYRNVGNNLAGGERAVFESETDIIRARMTLKLDWGCCGGSWK